MYRNRIAELVNDERFRCGMITCQGILDWLGEDDFNRELCALVDCAGFGKVQPEPGQVWVDAAGAELTVRRRDGNRQHWGCYQGDEFIVSNACFGGKHGWKLKTNVGSDASASSSPRPAVSTDPSPTRAGGSASRPAGIVGTK